MKKIPTIIMIIMILIAAISYTYLTIISPAFVEKPLIEKPNLQEENNATNSTEQIKEEHIQYMVNEIGGYKLHDDPITKEPAMMEIELTDKQESYTAIIKDNYPKVKKGKPKKADLKVSTTQDKLIILLASDNFEDKVVEMTLAGDMTIELLTDEKTLAIKGYKAIYNQLIKMDDVTGKVIGTKDTRKLFKEKLLWR